MFGKHAEGKGGLPVTSEAGLCFEFVLKEQSVTYKTLFFSFKGVFTWPDASHIKATMHLWTLPLVTVSFTRICPFVVCLAHFPLHFLN